jgi:hypothetical protein
MGHSDFSAYTGFACFLASRPAKKFSGLFFFFLCLPDTSVSRCHYERTMFDLQLSRTSTPDLYEHNLL